MFDSAQNPRGPSDVETRASMEGDVLPTESILSRLNRLAFSRRPVALIFKRAGRKDLVRHDVVPLLCSERLLTFSLENPKCVITPG